MTEFRKGDKVRVAFEAEVTNVREDGQRLWVYHAGVADTYLDVSDVELIERADVLDAAEQSSSCDKCGSRIVDDPSKDPVRTVRRSKDGKIAVRVREGEQGWIRLEIGENTWGWLFDDWVRGWEIVNMTIVERPLVRYFEVDNGRMRWRVSDDGIQFWSRRWTDWRPSKHLTLDGLLKANPRAREVRP